MVDLKLLETLCFLTVVLKYFIERSAIFCPVTGFP